MARARAPAPALAPAPVVTATSLREPLSRPGGLGRTVRLLLGLALLVLLAAPAWAATTSAGTVTVVQYDADSVAAPPPAELQGLPATVVDGVLVADNAPQGNPASAFAHFQEIQGLVDQRAATGAPVTIELDGRVEGGNLTFDVNATTTEALPSVRLGLVVVQDDPDGRRFVAVAAPPGAEGALAPDQPLALARTLPVNASWDPARLGVVAWVKLLGASGTFAGGEVVQSATWTAAQAAPTRQAAKAPLVEHATATWCEPCQPSDQAIALLAGAAGAQGGKRYALPPTPLAILGLAGGAVVGLVLVRRRAP